MQAGVEACRPGRIEHCGSPGKERKNKLKKNGIYGSPGALASPATSLPMELSHMDGTVIYKSQVLDIQCIIH